MSLERDAAKFGPALGRKRMPSDKKEQQMQTKVWSFMFGISLLAASSASAQVVSGVLRVTGAEMH